MENDSISENTVVEDAIYLAFKDSLICPICSNILINPLMCMNCQNVYCQKCVDEWSKKDNKCPNRCENPNYKKSIEKNNILSKLKFKCEKCGEEIFYDNVGKHRESCTPNNSSGKINNNSAQPTNNSNKPNNNSEKKNYYTGDFDTRTKRLKKLTKKELGNMAKEKLARITSKKN